MTADLSGSCDHAHMNILALESSCDDTAVAIVQDGRTVLSSVTDSQLDLHETFGGVLPELAARRHLEVVNPLIQQALDDAQLSIQSIDAIAATIGPGLIGSLLVSSTAAKTLSLLFNKPFRGVHHLYGHVASNYIDSDLKPPFLCLLVSGGHTQLIHVQDYTELSIVGSTLDDAVGEAYDKVARLIGLSYPGGPNLDKAAQDGNPRAIELPIARTKDPWDFSFSGLKTACLRKWEKEAKTTENLKQYRVNMAASFQDTVARTLVKKTLKCAKELGLKQVALCGGVAANSEIRKQLQTACEAEGLRFYKPEMAYCTDNAAMVGASAFFNPYTDDLSRDVFSRD